MSRLTCAIRAGICEAEPGRKERPTDDRFRDRAGVPLVLRLTGQTRGSVMTLLPVGEPLPALLIVSMSGSAVGRVAVDS